MAEAGNLEFRSPYPGLRPFWDTESSIFFGRDSQIQEVILRLRTTRFVALLGGSGSGKSSLVRAGIIPELRGYRIREAGDFWVPILATPGTNMAERDGPASARETPIDRLARKFVRLLRIRSDEESSRYQAEAVAALNKSGGFGGLINAFAGRFDLPSGPDVERANFMLVLDQFEEIFHWSNKDVPECTTLVERVLDHFYSPHPRVYLIITMRSEHLNDCAAFLRLPDAINKASYLVRRLEPSEIDETIEKPPRRYLRLLARATAGRRKGPGNFDFDERVLKRIQHDVEQIHSDPDHLALLQHLLARLWDAACDRAVFEGTDIPNHATMEDLERAVSATAKGRAPALPENGNALRLCLENWAQSIFDRFDSDNKKCFDHMLRRLAFKDPNTGMYTQQRLRLEEAAALLDGADPATLVSGFLPPCDYILWDDENPEQVTIKVFHEAFIRGWRHFQELIDKEAELFEEFVTLLKSTQTWLQSDRSARRLVEGEQLARVRESRLIEALHNPANCDRLFQLLELKHDSERYRVAPDDLRSFIETSIAAEDARIERAQAEELRTQELERQKLADQAENARLRAATLESNAKRHRIVSLIAVGVGVAAAVASVFFFNLKRTADDLKVEAEKSALEAAKNADKEKIFAQRARELAEQAEASATKAIAATQKEEAANAQLQAALKSARQNEIDAIEQRNRSSSLRLSFAADKFSQTNSQLAVLLALEALSLAQLPEAMAVLRDAVQSARVHFTPRAGGGHSGPVHAVAFDSARNRLATASDDNTVKVWNTETGREMVTLRGHVGRVLGVAFSRDGRFIASWSFDDTARLWDAVKGTAVRTFSGHRDTITSVAFTRDGKLVATGSEDRTAKLWETETGNDTQTFRGHNGRVRGVALSTDGRLATASDDGTAKLWDLTGKELLSLSGHVGPVTAVAFSEDGTKLATAGDDRLVRVWDMTSGKDYGKELQIFRGHLNAIRAVAFDDSGSHIATGGVDNSARLWNVQSGKLVRTFSGHQNTVTGVAFNAGGTLLATASADRTAKLWEVSSKEVPTTFGSPTISQVTASTFSPDGSRVATASGDVAVIWDAMKGNEIARFSGKLAKVSAIAFSADGRMLAVGADIMLKLFDANDPDKQARDLPGFGSPIKALAFSNDGKRLAASMQNGTVRVSDIDSGAEAYILKGHTGPVMAVAFSRDDRRIATGSYDDTAKVWDASNGKPLRTFRGHGDTINAIAFNPEGTRLATGSDDRSAMLWDLQTAQDLAITTMLGHSASVKRVAFVSIRKNTYLATTGDDGTARLWDIVNGKEERALRGHTAAVQDITVHPSQNLILTAAADRSVRAHPQTDADLVALARSRVTRSFSGEECERFEISGRACEVAKLDAEGRKRHEERKFGEAVAIYNKVYALNPKHVDADTWNLLCWNASLFGFAAAVVDGACEHAVRLSNGDANFVDSRGLARALTGKKADAIRDFEVYINDRNSDKDERDKRIKWVAELKAGGNPFTPAVLKTLR